MTAILIKSWFSVQEPQASRSNDIVSREGTVSKEGSFVDSELVVVRVPVLSDSNK